jgi:DNA invertase Pin-like site-specific DNA recombinase
VAVYGYTRVSTEDQVENTSLEDQARQIKGIAITHNLELEHIYEERGVSGAVPLLRREEGCKLAFLRAGDTVIVSKLDRMFRDARDALNVIGDWEEAGINLIINGYGNVMDKSNPNGRFMLEIMAVFSGEERRRIRERVLAGRKAKQQAGGFLGGEPPFGYSRSGNGRNSRLRENPEEQDAIITMKAARLKGHSYRDIVKIVAKKHGIDISHVTVRKIITGEHYDFVHQP